MAQSNHLSSQEDVVDYSFGVSFISIGIFLILFSSLQFFFSILRDSWVEHLIIDDLIVKTTAFIINCISPSLGADSSGSHIFSNGTSINVLNGCDGLDVIFMLVSAILVAPVSSSQKLFGFALGVPYVFMLIQLRLVTVFYALRYDRYLFEYVHGVIAPTLTVAFTILFFSMWLSRAKIRQR